MTRRDRVGFDLLRVPVVGRFLRWQHARFALQVPLAILAGLLILDGFRGPPVAPMNLAGVLPWIHWRGLLILGLLAGGNFFCMACPFTLPRRLAGRWLGLGRNWPRWLQHEVAGGGLAVSVPLVLRSLFAVGSPLVDGLDCRRLLRGRLRGRRFFSGRDVLQVRLSDRPVQLRAVPDVAAGGEGSFDQTSAPRARLTIASAVAGRIPGCQPRLYQPHKSSNMDCTFCLDCVHACPHDNVGLLAVLPGRQLWHDAPRSGIGRFARRPDLAALVVVLVFGALANAAGMVAPVLEWQDQLGSTLGHRPQWLITGLLAVGSFIVVPITAVGTAAVISRRWARLAIGPLETATRFSFALLPLGFGMWLAHYSFHFFTSWETIIPASQRLVQDLGGTFLGEPRYLCACCRPVGDGIVKVELLFLDAGLLMSLYAAYRIARAQASGLSRAVKAVAPWSVVILLLFVAAVWIVFQPMQMRGTLGGAPDDRQLRSSTVESRLFWDDPRCSMRGDRRRSEDSDGGWRRCTNFRAAGRVSDHCPQLPKSISSRPRRDQHPRAGRGNARTGPRRRRHRGDHGARPTGVDLSSQGVAGSRGQSAVPRGAIRSLRVGHVARRRRSAGEPRPQKRAGRVRC